jgi:predicted ATPase
MIRHNRLIVAAANWTQGTGRVRIVGLDVDHWRNLQGISIRVPPEARVVALVGENGSGKSTVLELVSFAALHLGLSTGVENPRGNPPEEDHAFTLIAELPESIAVQARAETGLQGVVTWDGLVRLISRRDEQSGHVIVLLADGVEDQYSAQLAQQAVSLLRARQETQHLYLDADRSYPPMQIQPHQFGEIWSQDWASPAFTRQFSHRPTKTLYEEWNKYFIATEETFASKYVADTRRARQSSLAAPEFVDPFDGYRESVLQVLPHLNFVGIQSSGATRTILFDSSGKELPFSKLSGGEREIAFLVGQIERFGLRQGLLLIDEPELHLNPDLLRTWVAFLRDTVTDGQVWLATHSLEAVEVAGPEASFVFDKDPADRLTKSVTLLSDRPVVSALSASVGAPAFSLAKLRFVFVEGDRQTRERERFFDICGDSEINRFVEGGSCHEVIRRLQYVSELAIETGEQLRVGGVIDRDFRPEAVLTELSQKADVHVLGCHEVENLFLQPEALSVIAERNQVDPDVRSAIVAASDSLAGLWIAQWAAARLDASISVPKAALTTWSGSTWSDVQARREDLSAASEVQFEEGHRVVWAKLLSDGSALYRDVRSDSEFWLNCMGKQVCAKLAGTLGYRGATFLQAAVVQLWRQGEVPEPPALDGLREYLRGLTTA